MLRSTARRSAPTASSAHRGTRLIGLRFVGLLLVFTALACVLTAQIPTTTRPDGFIVLPHVTATALALAALPAAQRTAVASQSKPLSPAAPVPSALRDHPALRQFPGPVLVPPTTLMPFAALAGDAPGISGSRCDGQLVCMPRYVIDYGQPTTNGGQIAGSGGRDTFDSDLSAAMTCATTGLVCAVPAVAGRPEVQYVRDLQLSPGVPAVARHQDCCPGPFWVLT